MRPSERKALREYGDSCPDIFLSELSAFLEVWANSKWLEEYNVERVSKWIGKHCPPKLAEAARKIALVKLAYREIANDNGTSNGCETNVSIRSRTYQVFLSGLTAH